jgi:hypothetical protein
MLRKGSIRIGEKRNSTRMTRIERVFTDQYSRRLPRFTQIENDGIFSAFLSVPAPPRSKLNTEISQIHFAPAHNLPEYRYR